jgi:hypothetical protein
MYVADPVIIDDYWTIHTERVRSQKELAWTPPTWPVNCPVTVYNIFVLSVYFPELSVLFLCSHMLTIARQGTSSGVCGLAEPAVTGET